MVALLLGPALLLASCGSPAAQPTGSTSTTVGASSTTTSTSQPATSTSSTTASGPPGCQVSQLSIVPQQGSGAAGQIELAMTMTNVSSNTCTLYGYPGLQMLDASGQPLPTNVVRGGTTFGTPVANQPPAEVVLTSQHTAAFTLHYEDVPVGNETSCPTSSKVEVTPPNDVDHAVVDLAITPCNAGTIHVSPVYSTA